MWEERWTKYLESIPENRARTPIMLANSRKRSKLHEGVSKATNSLITQIRTEYIELNGFLSDRKVSGYTPECECG